MFYIYVKNGKIMGSDENGKLNLGKPFPVELPGYYRLVDGVPKMTLNESDLDMKKDVYVGSRDWNGYYEKRKEATGKDNLEDTRGDDELKEEKKEESETEEETDENPTPENHSESEE